MTSEPLKAQILLAVAGGASLSDAARTHGVSVARAKQAIRSLCRSLKLSSEISDIQQSASLYAKPAQQIVDDPKYALRRKLREQLETVLLLKSSDELRVGYLSQISASTLIDAGLTPIAVAEVQEWLVNQGSTLKRCVPDEKQLAMLKQSAFFLHAFGLNVEQAFFELDWVGRDEDSDD